MFGDTAQRDGQLFHMNICMNARYCAAKGDMVTRQGVRIRQAGGAVACFELCTDGSSEDRSILLLPCRALSIACGPHSCTPAMACVDICGRTSERSCYYNYNHGFI